MPVGGAEGAGKGGLGEAHAIAWSTKPRRRRSSASARVLCCAAPLRYLARCARESERRECHARRKRGHHARTMPRLATGPESAGGASPRAAKLSQMASCATLYRTSSMAAEGVEDVEDDAHRGVWRTERRGRIGDWDRVQALRAVVHDGLRGTGVSKAPTRTASWPPARQRRSPLPACRGNDCRCTRCGTGIVSSRRPETFVDS